MAQSTSNRMAARRMVVAGLDRGCRIVDAVAYRPAVIKLTLRLPRWWRCELARLSVWLDDRWSLGYWAEGPVPDRVCDACNRRAASFVLGGPDEDEEQYGDFLEEHPVHLCGYCRMPVSAIENAKQLGAALDEARQQSITWRWS